MGRKNKTKGNGTKEATPAREDSAKAIDASPVATPRKDSLVKALEGVQEGATQMTFLLERFEQLEIENANLTKSNNELSRKCSAIPLYEKKISQGELVMAKTELAKAQLENLCRELQNQNRELKKDTTERMQQMEQERMQLVEQFKANLKEIQESMNSGNENHKKLYAENQALMEKMQSIAKNYEERFDALRLEYEAKDKLNANIMKSKELEKTLLIAKLESEEIRREKAEHEKHRLEVLVLNHEERFKTCLETEKSLRQQLLQYGSKYEELTKSLTNSNDAFDKFKKQMEKMNGNLIKVERESRNWKTKYDQASTNVLSLALEKKELEEAMERKNRQLGSLEQLCRRLRNGNATPEAATANGEAEKRSKSDSPTTEELAPEDGSGPSSSTA